MTTLTRALLCSSWVIPVFSAVPLPEVDLALLGPSYQTAANSSSQAFEDARTLATAAINQIITTGNSTYGPFDNETTSFSLSVFSASHSAALYEFHFEAPGLNGSYTKDSLTEDTIYRAGSLGKLMTVYTFLVDIGDDIFTDPVTKYIPELAEANKAFKNPILSTNWSEITIGSLASQLSGIGRDFNFGDLAIETFENPPLALVLESGYPSVANETVTQCNFYGDQQPSCTRAQTLEGIINHPPSFPSYSTPSYSNLAYLLLGLVYENITGRTIDDGQIDVLTNRLKMSSTYPRPPPGDVDAIIPYNESFSLFSYDLGLLSPAGGQYISTKDLRTWGQAILKSTLLPRALTGRWLKPRSFTSQWASAVGAPFEIYRLQIPSNDIIDAGRIVDTYCKQGDVGSYSTYFGIVPDLDIGISVLAAGTGANRQVPPVRDTVVELFYAAADAAAKEQARRAFTGTFEARTGNSSITMEVDGGPGVSVTSFISNDVDFLQNAFLAKFDYFRLFPTRLSFEEGGITYFAYRLQYFRNNGEPVPGDFWSEYNDWWLQVDNYLYNNLATDAFVIGFDSDGIVQSVESQALRTTMYRA